MFISWNPFKNDLLRRWWDIKNHSLINLLEFVVQCSILGALYSGCYSSRSMMLLSAVDLFGESVHPSVEALCLKLNVTSYTAFFLYHAEATHAGHQALLLLAELEDLLLPLGQKKCISLQNHHLRIFGIDLGSIGMPIRIHLYLQCCYIVSYFLSLRQEIVNDRLHLKHNSLLCYNANHGLVVLRLLWNRGGILTCCLWKLPRLLLQLFQAISHGDRGSKLMQPWGMFFLSRLMEGGKKNFSGMFYWSKGQHYKLGNMFPAILTLSFRIREQCQNPFLPFKTVQEMFLNIVSVCVPEHSKEKSHRG